MKDISGLKRFLIWGFVRTIVITSVAEVILVWILEHTLIRWIFIVFFGTGDVNSLSAVRLAGAMLLMMLVTLAGVASYLAPGYLASPVRWLVTRLGGMTAGLLGIPEQALRINSLSNTGRAVLWLLILAAVIIIIIPVALAAFYFARIVIREFRSIEDRENEARLEYERKRNLMISDIAHDLRTPMTTISGYARALEDGLVSDAEKPEIYASIRSKTSRMNDLIGFLFDYVKLDSAGFTLNMEDVDVCELLRENVALLFTDIEAAGMSADIDIPEERIMVRADRLQLSRIFSNLISNAVKHNAPGTRIGVFLKTDSDIHIVICDDGAPIPAEKADAIFDPFVMGDESRQSTGGSGLGLSIAKKIAEMHGFAMELVQNPASPYVKAFVITAPKTTYIKRIN